jgi:hypothetical protein
MGAHFSAPARSSITSSVLEKKTPIRTRVRTMSILDSNPGVFRQVIARPRIVPMTVSTL